MRGPSNGKSFEKLNSIGTQANFVISSVIRLLAQVAENVASYLQKRLNIF